jgi:hypothetical protein
MVIVVLAAVGLAACGGSSTHRSTAAQAHTGATGPGGATGPSTGAGAKRRYLAHFNSDCHSAGRLGKATGNVIGSLSAQIAHGNLAAVAELNLFLQRLAATYQAGLRGTLALGLPPAPDAHDGRAYLTDTQRMISAIRDMGAAVGRLDGPGLHAASTRLHDATTAASRAAKRYGFPSCGGSSGTPALPSVSGAPA